jgi:type I restriction enzyme, S subunit
MAIDGWTRMPLGQFVTLQRGHDLPDERRRPGNVPILGSFGITGWHDEAKARGPGVTVGRSGASFGVISYSPVDYWPLNTALYVVDFHGNDARFAYYFLKRFDFKAYNSGSAQPSLNRNFVHPVLVDVPPTTEQRVIARILGALDDKIELNRRMIATLDAISQTVFESSFGDFCGQQIGTLSEVALQKRDQENPLDSPDAIFAHFSIPAFDEGQSPTLERGKDIKSIKWQVAPGAVLLSKLNPEIERVWLVDVNASDRAVCSTEFLVLYPREPFDRAYVYCLARSPAFRRQIEALVTGTSKSHQRARVDTIFGLPVVLPKKDAVTKFQKAASPLLERAIACRRESRTLAELRDSLLPKLISGDLRVSELAKIAAAAA